jgi:para-nitrobenzyl esterase
MVDFWTNFAKYGNPNGSTGDDPWSPVTPESPAFMVLDVDGEKATFTMAEEPGYRGGQFPR